MRIWARIGMAYVLLVLIGAIWRALPFEIAAPQIPLIIAAYAGLSANERLPTALFSAVIVGYLGDLLAGTPIGLMAFVCGVVCWFTRVVSSRLLVRGRRFTLLFCLAATLFGLLLGLLVRSYVGVPGGPFWSEVWLIAACTLLTGVLAPIVLSLCRRVDARFADTQRDRAALRSGYLS